MNKKLITYSMLIVVTFFWGSSFVLTEAILTDNQISPFLLTFLRLLFSIIFFLVLFLFLPGKFVKIKRKDFPVFLGLALFQPFFYFIGENYGIMYSSSSAASIIIASIPVFVPFAVFLVWKEPLHFRNVGGALLSMCGIGIISLHVQDGFYVNWKGLLFLLMAVFSMVGYSVLLQKIIKTYSPLSITFYQNILGLLLFTPLVLFFDVKSIPHIVITPHIIFYILFLGVISSSVAFLMYNQAVKNIGVVKASIFENAIPVFTLLIVCLLGIEKISWKNIIGILIVIFGVCISQISGKNYGKKRYLN